MRDEPWLSDEQQHVWRAFLRMSGQLNERIERDLQQAAGMPHAYYLILAMLSEAPGRSLRMNQLAEVVRASQSRVSHAVARLEEAGWVRRIPAPGRPPRADRGADRCRVRATGRGRAESRRDRAVDHVRPAEPGAAGKLPGHLLDNPGRARRAGPGDARQGLLTGNQLRPRYRPGISAIDRPMAQVNTA